MYKRKKCNRKHGSKNCPVSGKSCYLCKKLIHFAVGRKNNKKVQQVTEKDFTEIFRDDDFSGVFGIDIIILLWYKIFKKREGMRPKQIVFK